MRQFADDWTPEMERGEDVAPDTEATDQLVQTVREALNWSLDEHDYGGTENPLAYVREARAALDALAHELKRLKVGRDGTAEAYRELEGELERLQNKLNTDSQNFELEARKAQIASLEAELERVNGLLNDNRRLALGAALDDAQRELERVKASRDEALP